MESKMAVAYSPKVLLKIIFFAIQQGYWTADE
jgi:hypothetical protein